MSDRDKIAEIIRDARINASPMAQLGYPEADALLDYGVIIPPCKVGDIIYAPFDYWSRNEIIPYQITNLTITQNKKLEWTKKYRAMVLKNGKTIDKQVNFEFKEIGKTVFLTREDAEKKLKELGE